jgi:hypothetical protein
MESMKRSAGVERIGMAKMEIRREDFAMSAREE